MFPTNNAAILGTGFVCERVVGEPIDVRYYLWHSIYDPQLEFNRSNCSHVFSGRSFATAAEACSARAQLAQCQIL